MSARVVVGLLFGLAVLVRGIFFVFPTLDSDQAIIGLMGLHILKGEFPLFFWGEPYSGTLESFLAALFFFLLGASRETLTLAPALASLGFVWADWRLAREVFGERTGLIALALLALPPVLLSWNSTLARGNYVETLFLGTLCLLLALRLQATDLAVARERRLALLLGGLAGLAWYMSFQSVHYLAAVVVFLLWRRGLAIARALPLALPAFLIGSLPFWIHNLTTAFASLDEIRRYSGHAGLREGARTLLGQLAVLVGVQSFTYTYERVSVTAVPLLAPLVGGLVAVAVGAALGRGLGRPRSPGVLLLALFSLTVVVVILLGGFSTARDARYLLPLYSALPLLLADGIACLWRWRPLALGALALVLASNAYGHGSLVRGERERFPRYRAEDRQVIASLRAQGLTHLYAPDYWVSYRLTFEAGEAPLIATPFWRDYPRILAKYPPYVSRVRAAARPAYLLWGSVNAYRGTLRAAGVEHRATPVGRFTVLEDFRWPAPGRSLSAGAWRGSDALAPRAFDRDPRTAWRGTELTLDLGAVHRVQQVVLHLADLREHPDAFALEGSRDGRDWERLAGVTAVVPGFSGVGGKLVLEEHGRVALAFPSTPLRHLRIRPGPAARPWTLTELFVFEEAADGGSPPRFMEAIALEERREWAEALTVYATVLLEHPDDEAALTRAMSVARELGLDGLAQVYDFLSARTLDPDPARLLRFARRFHALAGDRDAAWRRLAEGLRRAGDAPGAEAVLATMARHFSPAVARDVEFGRDVRFLGFTLEPSPLRPGSRAEIRYFWQLLRPLPPGVWVSLRVGGRKEILLTHDHRIIQDGSLADWRPGETVRETYSLEVPAGLALGTHPIRLKLWEPASGHPLRVWHGLWPTSRRAAIVGEVEVRR